MSYRYKVNWGTHRVVTLKGAKVVKVGDVFDTNDQMEVKFPLFLNGQPKFAQVAQGPLPTRPDIPVARSPSVAVVGAPEQAPTIEQTEAVPTTEQTEAVPVTVPENITAAVIEEDVVVDTPKYGEEVTGEFVAAEALRFKIYYDGAKYSVVSIVGKKLLNKKQLIATPKEVKKFLKRYQE